MYQVNHFSEQCYFKKSYFFVLDDLRGVPTDEGGKGFFIRFFAGNDFLVSSSLESSSATEERDEALVVLLVFLLRCTLVGSS